MNFPDYVDELHRRAAIGIFLPPQFFKTMKPTPKLRNIRAVCVANNTLHFFDHNHRIGIELHDGRCQWYRYDGAERAWVQCQNTGKKPKGERRHISSVN